MAWREIAFYYPNPHVFSKHLLWLDKNANIYFGMKENNEDAYTYYAGTAGHALDTGLKLTEYATEALAQTNYLTTVRDTTTGKYLAILPGNVKAKHIALYVESGNNVVIYEWWPSVYISAHEIVAGQLLITSSLSDAPSIKIEVSAQERVFLGNIGGGVYGLRCRDASNNIVFQSDTSAQGLAGWTFTNEYLYKLETGTPTVSPNNGVVIRSGSTPVITAYEGTLPRIKLGYLAANVYGLIGYNSSGSEIFQLSDGGQHIGGWYINTWGIYKIVSGDVGPPNTVTGTVLNASNAALPIGLSIYTSGTERLIAGEISSGLYGIQCKDASGNIVFRSDSTAQNLAGWTFTTTALTASSGTVGISSAITGDDDIRFWAGHVTPASAAFRVYESGALVATSATITGSITATTGVIGGWNINSLGLYRLWAGTVGNGDETGVILYSTSAASDAGVFVLEAGVNRFGVGRIASGVYGMRCYNSSGTIIVKVDTTGAEIAGWTISTSTLANSTNIILDSSNKAISLNSATYGTDGIQLQYNAGNPRAYVGDGANQYVKFDGTNLSWKGTNTELTAAGAFTASSATITGVITANTGYIGGASGWVIAAGKMTSTGIGLATAAGDVTYAFWAGDNTPASAEFRVTHAGALVATSATITGSITAITGNIGGWSIASNCIYRLVSGVLETPATWTGIFINATNASAPFGMGIYNAGVLRLTLGEVPVVGSGVYGLRCYDSTPNAILQIDTSGTATISGFTISYAEGLYSGSGSSRVQMKHGAGIWTGATAIGDAPFSVTNAGVLKATSGTIGGWTLAASTLTSAGSTITLDAGNSRIDVGNVAADGIRISSVGIALYDGGTQKGAWDIDSGWWLGPSSTNKKLEWDPDTDTFYVRGNAAFDTIVFQEVLTTKGSLVVAKSGGELWEAATATGSTFTIKITKSPSGGAPFANGDVCKIDNGPTSTWFTVGTGSDSGFYYTYTATYQSGSSSGTYKPGTGVVDYGPSGQGWHLITVDESDSPRYSIYTHAGSPWSTTTEVLRIGRLNNFLGYPTTQYGIAVGTSVASYLWYDPVSGLEVAGIITATSGRIGGSSGWVIGTGKMTSTGIGLATSVGDATYAFWAGSDTSASAPFRVTHAGALTATSATISGTITASCLELTTSAASYLQTSTKTSYADADAGIWAGYVDSAYKVAIGTNTYYLKWSGTNLSWAGQNTSLTEAGAFAASNATLTGNLTLTGSDTNPNPNVITFDGTNKSKLGTNAAGSIVAWVPLTTNTCDLHIGYDAIGAGYFDKRWDNIWLVGNSSIEIDVVTNLEISARPTTYFNVSDYRRALLWLTYDGSQYSAFLGAGYSTTQYAYFNAIAHASGAGLFAVNYDANSCFTFSNHDRIILSQSKTPADTDGSDLITSWTNVSYATFTTSGGNITRAVWWSETPATQTGVSNSITIVKGNRYRLTCTLTLAFGTTIGTTISGTNGFPTTTLNAGATVVEWIATGTSCVLTVSNTSSCDWACTFDFYNILRKGDVTGTRGSICWDENSLYVCAETNIWRRAELVNPKPVLHQAYDYSVLVTDAGTIITNYGAAAHRTMTLPPAAACIGSWFTFCNANVSAKAIQVFPTSPDVIYWGDDLTGAGEFLTSTTLGNSITLRSLDAGSWTVVAHEGTGWAIA